MYLQQLITFCRVVESGSLTRAGELLNLSQPAVTRQVAALEAEYHSTLLERQGRSLRLTPAGQVVYSHARRILTVLEQSKEAVAALAHPERGQVSIACVTTVGLFTLPALLRSFSEQYPDVRFRIWSGRINGVMDHVLEGEADLGLVTMPVTHPRLDSVPLFRDPVVLVAAPDLAQRLPQPLPLEQLAELEMITYQAPSRFRTVIEAHLEEAGVYPRVAMEFDSHEAVKTMVQLGYGVALVPESAVLDVLESGRLVTLQVQGLPQFARTTSMVLKRDAVGRSPAAANFIRLVLERYGGADLPHVAPPEPEPGA